MALSEYHDWILVEMYSGSCVLVWTNDFQMHKKSHKYFTLTNVEKQMALKLYILVWLEFSIKFYIYVSLSSPFNSPTTSKLWSKWTFESYYI